MLKLKLQYFGYLIWRADSLEKTLVLGKTEGKRRRVDRGRDGWMTSLTHWTWVWANSGRWWRTRKPGVLQFMGSQRVGHNCVTEQQQVSLLINVYWKPNSQTLCWVCRREKKNNTCLLKACNLVGDRMNRHEIAIIQKRMREFWNEARRCKSWLNYKGSLWGAGQVNTSIKTQFLHI